LPRTFFGASAMSTMTAFFKSRGLTSPYALPASFSYWPTPDHG
jgi:hypothetical protein